MSRARKVRGRAITKEAVRGTAWSEPELPVVVEPSPREELDGLTCPRCGGELAPVMGWQRILDPKMVCLDCRYLWSDTEALAGSWYRADGHPESRLVRQQYLLTTGLILGGVIFGLLLVLKWIGLERDDSWERDAGFHWLVEEEPTGRRWTARIVVPVMLTAWAVLVVHMIRLRENTTPTALATIGWLVTAVSFAVAL